MTRQYARGHVRGERHPKAKGRLSDEDVLLIRRLHEDCSYGSPLGYKAIARKFGCHRNTVRYICLNKRRMPLSPEEISGHGDT